MNNEQPSREIIREERAILKEEQKILAEERTILKKVNRTLEIAAVAASLLIVGAAAGLVYWRSASSRVYADKAAVAADRIDLAPESSGTLEEVFVREGDSVQANAPVARVGNELIKAKVAGLVIAAKDDIGKLINRGEPVVSMIEPDSLRVVASLEEDKGLRDVRIGQLAVFTLDAFGSKKFSGTVDEISPTSKDSGAVFSISDKREVRDFDVKIRFNAAGYPGIKNGMSAKVWIYKD